MMGGFGAFTYFPNGVFQGYQTGPTGTAQIQGQWQFDGQTLVMQGAAGVMPYFVGLSQADIGQGYFKARSHDGFDAVFQWTG